MDNQSMSSDIKDLATALSKAQSTMKSALKDKENPHFRSKYADLDAIWDACRESLTENGLSVIQTHGSDQSGAFLKTLLVHSSGQFISSITPLILPDRATMQQLGSAITYARRYSLASIVGVTSDEDDDGNAVSQKAVQISKKQEQHKIKLLSNDQYEYLLENAYLANPVYTREKISEEAKSWSYDYAQQCIDKIKVKIDQKKSESSASVKEFFGE